MSEVGFVTPSGSKVEFIKVVKCKDCIHNAINGLSHVGSKCCIGADPEWFCADGEPKRGMKKTIDIPVFNPLPNKEK